jgi:hypothetical protein
MQERRALPFQKFEKQLLDEAMKRRPPNDYVAVYNRLCWTLRSAMIKGSKDDGMHNCPCEIPDSTS